MVFFARHFCHAVPDATPVFTDWLAECKRQLRQDGAQGVWATKILVIVGLLQPGIEYVVGGGQSFGSGR